MVGYYLSGGDPLHTDMFKPYLWGKHGLNSIMKELFPNKIYGSDLKLLLIQYYVEGEFSRYMPEVPKMGNYSNKNKDIAVAIGIPRHLFHDRNEFERREFLVDSTLNAIKIVKEKLSKKKLNIDFESMINDVKIASKPYLKHKEKYSEI